ncbi:hypothetical protein G6F22_006761 [Rhizopus arrhizus]|nr:hypothetical protein G6F22_006761 [Rhizopus arrhizus]
MNFGELADEATSFAIMDAAVDAGINLFDSADVYGGAQSPDMAQGFGLSEEIIGRWLKRSGKRDGLVLATKVYQPMGPGPNDRRLSAYHIRRACEASLRRLQTDHIDLYQIHGFDPATPVEETVRALDTLVQHGHVRYVGVSNWAAWQIMKALGIAERLGLARFESLQAYYTIAGRDLDRELVPMLQSEGVGLMVWSPLAGGLLSGKYGRDGSAEAGSRRAAFDFPPVDRDRAYDSIDVLKTVADARGVSVAQVALAWLLHQQVVTSVIIGAKRVDQLDDNLAATGIKLTQDELAALDKVSALPPEYPGWMHVRQGEFRRKQLAESGAA